MLWFFKSFFPVVWIAFLLYWRIKAADTKTTQRREPTASGILRLLAFLIVTVLLSTTRIPLPWLYRQLWPSGITRKAEEMRNRAAATTARGRYQNVRAEVFFITRRETLSHRTYKPQSPPV